MGDEPSTSKDADDTQVETTYMPSKAWRNQLLCSTMHQ